jgi:hypothetical protein
MCTRTARCSLATLAILLLASCGDLPTVETPDVQLSAVPVAKASLPQSATLTFGVVGVGSPFEPPSGHDASGHAYDKILPHVVNIAAGGRVTIDIGPFHAAAVYDDGTRPEDITISPATLDDLSVPFPPGVLPDFIINDPSNRIAASPPLNPVAPTTWTTPAGTFDTPGRYLVICTVLPHFAGAKMYAYVNVH